MTPDTTTSTAPARTLPSPAFTAVAWGATARALVRLAWARTATPVLLLAMAGLVLLPLGFALVFASRGSLSGDPVDFLVQRYDQLIGALATPLLALLLGTSAFSAEAEDGTLLYLVTTRTPRWWLVTVRLAFAALVAGSLSSLAVWGAGFIAANGSDPEGVTGAYTTAVFVGGVAYSALFTLLALRTRRALLSGLVYILFWEGVLSGTFQGLNYLSIRQWMLSVAGALTSAQAPRLAAAPSVGFALGATGALLVLTIVLGARQLATPRTGRVGT